MIKDYKAVALKQSAGTGANTYTFIVKGQNQKEASINAQNHILNSFEAKAIYHIELSLIGDSLIQ
tara:strand:- start:539 stop:733 length:195 start_codon:yes stop_codon:yes gene_type:complete